jgi:hypothetical protein
MSFTPDFKHRLAVPFKDGQELSLRDMIDTIMLMTEQATSVLHVISLQFESDNSSMLNSSINYAAISAAIRSIEDIDCIVSAFSSQEHAKTDTPPNGTQEKAHA